MIGSNFVLILGAVCIIIAVALNIYLSIEERKNKDNKTKNPQ